MDNGQIEFTKESSQSLSYKRNSQLIKKIIITILVFFIFGAIVELGSEPGQFSIFYYPLILITPIIWVLCPLYLIVTAIKYLKKDKNLDILDGIIFSIISLMIVVLLIAGLS